MINSVKYVGDDNEVAIPASQARVPSIHAVPAEGRIRLPAVERHASMTSPSVVLITGASTGIGHAMALLLRTRGYRVFGASRNPIQAGASGIDMVALDVTSDESVAAGIRAVLERAGHIDILINNVGYALLGSAEETSLTELTAQLDTNFLGAVRVTSAVLPHLRAQRHGKIINISSLGGLAALPYSSAYAASKFALEGYSEALRHELRSFGVYVSLVEPSNVRTETLATSIRRSAAANPAYAAARERIIADFKAAGLRSTVEPATVARVVAGIVEHPAPRLRYPIGPQARLVPLLKALLPQAIFEAIIRRQLQLDATRAVSRRMRQDRKDSPDVTNPF